MHPTKNIEDLYPLSPMQQGMLFHTLLSPDAGIYVPQIDLTLEGAIDPLRLKQSWQQVVAQHPILRTAFQWEKRNQPFQVVYRQVDLPWQEQDWRDLPHESHDSRLDAVLEADRHQGFDLKAPPLLRLSLIRVAETRYHLLWTQHHLILDGWSAALVLKDVFAAYRGAAIPLRPPYRHQIAWLQQQDLTAAQSFWTEQMQGLSEPTLLPIAHATTANPHWAEQQLTLSDATTATLKALAQQHQITLNTVIQGAFALLLGRYADRDDVCFGATYAGRNLPGSEAMVGLLINTLPVRVRLIQGRSHGLIPWLQSLQAQQAVAMQYDYCSLLDIQSWSEIPRGTPLFESLLVFENYPVDAGLQAEAAFRISQIRSIEWTSVPMTLLVSGTDRLIFKLKFDRHRFPTESVHRLLTHWQTLLEAIATQPSLHELPLLTLAEQQQFADWNQTAADEPQQCLPDLFEAQVERTPDAIASVFEDSHLTYRELNNRANQLAHFLRSLGIQPEAIVGICADRSLDLAISILAVLKAGAAYLPLDPGLPPDRLAYMLADARVSRVLTHFDPQRSFDPQKSFNPQRSFDPQRSEDLFYVPIVPPSHFPPTNPSSVLTRDHSISVIYTSGSTGVPKGVINTHRGIVNRLAWMQSEYGLKPADRVLQKTPLSFDVSAWEFFWPLLNGACLVLAQPGKQGDSRYLAQLIADQQITTLHFVPAMLQAFLDELETEPALNYPALLRVFCSGEALPTALASRLLDCLSLNRPSLNRLNLSLYNLYGPTEAAIDVTHFEVTQPLPATSTLPIGRPIHNTQIYILDRHLRSVPIGVPGELYIGGIGLARGYLNRPELTAEKFIPGSQGERLGMRADSLYRTGDLARYLPNGAIEYLGRLDHQVKLRGFRIELGEVEAALMRHPIVQSAVVTLLDMSHPQLVAYLVIDQASQSVALDLDAVLPKFLKGFLPEYMIPSLFVEIAALPLLSNGKLDRRALPAPEVRARATVLPRNPTEKIVAAIWAEVLQQEAIGIHDPFFELGGNSLLATQINSRLRQAFQLDLPLKTLFEQPTVAALAERITTLQLALQPPPLLTAGRKEIEL